MTGPARLTPTGLQPGSAETFATFVQGVPAAKTPFTGNERVPLIQNGFTVYAPPVDLGAAGRTILTANTNYYVAVGGSDSNSGLSLGAAWATLQHAMNIIASTLDIAGFTITINIGAGTFVGFGTESTVGGGNVYFFGAGVTHTFITDGPNDGVINFGEAFDVELPIVSIVFFDALTLKSVNLSAFSGMASIYVPCTVYFGGNPTFGAATFGLDFTNALHRLHGINIATTAANINDISSTTTVTGGTSNPVTFINVQAGSQYLSQLSAWSVSGTPTMFTATVQAVAGGIIEIGGSTFSGAGIIGPRFSCIGGSVIFDPQTTLGPTFFPGSSAGVCDNSSSYDGFPGSDLIYPQSTTTLRTVLTANTNFYVATTGSDSNSGSITSKWATLQHAATFIGANLDFAGFTVTVNIAAGTFVGCGYVTTVGGGIFQFTGAGPASTTINPGPNDGVINFGECFDVEFTSPAVIGVDQVTFVPGAANNAVANYSPATSLIVGNATSFTGNVTFSIVNVNANCITALGVGSQTSAFGTFTIAKTGAGTLLTAWEGEQNTTLIDDAAWTITGTPSITNAFLLLNTAAVYGSPGGSYSGAATGSRFNISFSSAAGQSSGPGTLGPNYFPGSVAGTVDASSAYDGFPGPIAGIDTQTGASYTLAIGDAFSIVEMNNAGANTLTVPTNASVAFEIGTKIRVVQTGAGATTIAGAGGVTVDNAGALGGRWQAADLYKRGTNEWVQIQVEAAGAGASFAAGVSTGGNTSGTTAIVSSQVVFAGGNNVTLSESTNGQSATITISAANQTNQTVGAYAVGNTTTSTSSMTADARSLSFDGAGIVSVGMSGGSVVISATSGFTQSAQTDGIYASVNTTGTSSSSTHDARSLTIDGDGIVSVGWSSNSHFIISASQSAQTLGLIAVGNTTTSTSSMTADARSLSFDGAGIVSVGMSGGSVVISASDAAQTNQTLGLFAVGNTTTSTSSMTADARSLSFDGAGAVSVGMSGGSVVLSAATQTNQTLGLYAVGNTTGASSSTTLDARTFSHDGAGQVSVGYSAGSLIISGPPILSAFEPHQLYSGFGQSLGQNSLWFDPFNLDAPVTVSVAQLGLSLSGAASVATTATVAGSYDFALYTRQTGASSTRLSSIFSTQATFSARFSSNVSNTIAFNGVSAATGTATNLMLGNKIAQVPCVTFLPPGEYWAAHLMSTASTGSAALSVSNIFQVENLSTWGQLGGSLNSQGYLNQFMDGQGTFSVTTGGFPATLAISAISQATSGVPYYNLRNFGTA